MPIPYSAEKVDLYFPAKRAAFFPNGRPVSDAALCVEMARLAYCQLDGTFPFDQPAIRKILGRIGFTQCAFFEHPVGANGGGSHGLLALDAKANLAVLAFRGTNASDPTDIMDDFDAVPNPWPPGGHVSSGFANAFMVLWDQQGLEKAVQQIKGYDLLLTGHSLGAAMATLAASLVTPKSLYTIGSPRVGDAAFVKTLSGLDNHRYVDCCDMVARVPPAGFLGYQHIPGQIHYIASDRTLSLRDPSNAIDAGFMASDQADAEIDYLKNYAWRIGDVAVRALADHAPVNYVLPVTAATP
jgi:pimeloyl-ACP methyl ester carboxylesterase